MTFSYEAGGVVRRCGVEDDYTAVLGAPGSAALAYGQSGKHLLISHGTASHGELN